MCVCVRECVCESVCVRERERCACVRERVCVCVCERERVCERDSVCERESVCLREGVMCVCERERVCACEREREFVCVIEREGRHPFSGLLKTENRRFYCRSSCSCLSSSSGSVSLVITFTGLCVRQCVCV